MKPNSCKPKETLTLLKSNTVKRNSEMEALDEQLHTGTFFYRPSRWNNEALKHYILVCNKRKFKKYWVVQL